VTLVFETQTLGNGQRNDSILSVNSGSNLLLNSPGAGGSVMPGPWVTGDATHNVPITIWIKPDPACPSVPIATCASSSVFNMGSASGLDVRGIIFGPTDDMKIAGNGAHHGAGEIWAWTIEYVGNSTLDQVYQGAGEGYPLIVE
jgi:hypothetical protein